MSTIILSVFGYLLALFLMMYSITRTINKNRLLGREVISCHRKIIVQEKAIIVRNDMIKQLQLELRKAGGR